jgi:hypothetical protein
MLVEAKEKEDMERPRRKRSEQLRRNLHLVDISI